MYPTISEYIEAIKSAEDNFKELTNLRPVLGDNGLPVMTSGNFAVVFKMQDEQSGKFYAVKCFTKEQEGRANAYREIANELKDVSSSYLVSIRYLEKELFVDTVQTAETEFPVLLMDWVEGKTLDKYLRENLDDKFVLEMLAYRFSQLAQWLIPQPFAHGDLKPDNILVREDGTLVLVDYDGMYVPAMKGQRARELGSPNFRHPLRTENDFDEHIDEFPIVSILLSLKAISINPQLLEDYGAPDRLLYSDSNYIDLLKEISSINNSELNSIKDVLVLFLLKKNIGNISQYLELSVPQIIELPRVEQFADAWTDEYGAKYSNDKKCLLKGANVANYSILDGTEIICDGAFMFCKELTSIYLPKTLKRIGNSVFVGTKVSRIKCDSPLFGVEDNILFSYDKKVLYYYPENRKEICYEVPAQVKKIIKGCFSTASYLWVIKLRHIQYDFDELISDVTYLSIPNGTKKYINVNYKTYGSSANKHSDIVEVRNNIFEGDLLVENGVVYSSDKSILYRYPYWLEGEEYRVDEKCKIIEEAAFDDSYGQDEYGQRIWFNKLKTLYLPNGLEEIKDYAFVGCGYLENLTIPPSVKFIGNYVFGQCVNLITLTFLSKIDFVGKNSFNKGMSMPGRLVNPYEPYVSCIPIDVVEWKNEVDIIVCPKGTDDYYKEIFDNTNSFYYQLDKDEQQIIKEAPNFIHDKDYFLVTSHYLKSNTTLQMREKLKDVVCTKYYGLAGKGIGIDLSKLKTFMGLSFNVFKKTNRFHFRQELSGICYVTKNYRSRFISDYDSFTTIDDAVDFACKVYYDIYGNVLDLDIE